MAAIQGPWIPTASGRPYPVLHPGPEWVRLSDIAEQLAKQNRWSGASELPVSIAQHSVLVRRMLTGPAAAYGLFHDAPEFVLGDRSRPLKDALRALGCGGFDELERRHEAAIFEAVGLAWPMPPEIARLVKHADNVVAATEARDTMPDGATLGWPRDFPAPASARIRPWPWADAATHFMREAAALADAGLISLDAVT